MVLVFELWAFGILASWVLNYREGIVGPLKGESDTRYNRQMRVTCYAMEGLVVFTTAALTAWAGKPFAFIVAAGCALVMLLCYFLGWLFHRRPRERRFTNSI